MKIGKRSFLAIGLAPFSWLISGGAMYAAHPTVRWDVISVQPPPPAAPRDVLPGGIASARANDNSKITLAGSGTFQLKPGNQHVTGGGTWTTFAPDGTTVTGTGTYEVTGVVTFKAAPGTPNPDNIDRIGDPAETSAGLAVLTIAYSDGSEGILVVSCHLVGTPDSVFEGITATKGFADFWNREPPADGVDANRTVFHISAK